jgi:hypothetical protein
VSLIRLFIYLFKKIYRSAKLKSTTTKSSSVHKEEEPTGPKIVEITEPNLSVDDCLD